MFKRYTYQGGVCRPARHLLAGGIRPAARCATSTTTRPTSSRRSSSAAASSSPTSCRATSRRRCRASRCVQLRRRRRPDHQEVQYYEMFGTRGLWHDGWKVVAERGPMIGTGDYENDTWQLFHTDVDRSEAHDLAPSTPRRSRSSSTSGSSRPASTTCSRSTTAASPSSSRPAGGADPARRRLRYYPGTLEVPGVRRGQHARAVVQDPRPGRGRRRRGGRDLRPGRALRRPRAVRQGPQALVRLQLHRHPARAAARLRPRVAPGGTCSASSSSRRASASGTRRRDGQALRRRRGRRPRRREDAARPLRACGEGLSVGRDSSDPVSKEYTARFAFSGGTIVEVEVNIGEDVYLDVEREFAAAMARD